MGTSDNLGGRSGNLIVEFVLWFQNNEGREQLDKTIVHTAAINVGKMSLDLRDLG